MANAQIPTVSTEDVGRRTLRALIHRLHPAVLEVLVAPAGLDRVIGDPVILDPVDDALPPVDSVVLAVGVDTPRAQAALLDRLTGADVAAVVLKNTGPIGTVAQGAHAAKVAVLSAPPAFSWGQLYSFLLTATSAPLVNAAEAPEAPLGDLFALVNAVAAMVGGATTIEDPANRVLAYSNLDFPIDPARRQTILGRAVPGDLVRRLQDADVFRRLSQSEDVMRIAELAGETGSLSRLAVAVRAGGELLGTIWVIEGAQQLGPEAWRTLRDAADIVALHLLHHRTAGDAERHRRAEALLRLLDGVDHGERTQATLGFDLRQPVTVVAFDVGSGSDAAAIMAARRVADLVAYHCESYRRHAPCAARGSRVYALLPGQTDAASESAAAFARAIVDLVRQTLRLPLRGAVGSTAAGLVLVGQSRQEADEVLDVLACGTGETVASIESMRSRVTIHRLRRLVAEHPELTEGKVLLLADQDVAKGTTWIPTLRAYFDSFGDMAKAAASVSVHPNTFRYRLRRITELFGLDLDDPDERLVAELQLRFVES